MTITPRKVVMEAGSETAVFEEGAILTNSTVTAKVGGLLKGHTFEATTSGYLDRVGNAKNKVDRVVIYDADGNVVTNSMLSP